MELSLWFVRGRLLARIEIENYRQLGKPVHEDQASIRLDDYLGRYFLFMSRTQWKKAIREPKILVNEEAKKGSYKLRTDDIIHYYSPEDEEPKVDKGIKVLWNDRGVIAVYKPSNLPIHEGGAYKSNTFCKVLEDQEGSEWAPVHRLDRETSGLVLCGNTTELRNALSESLRTHSMQKTYFAIGVGEADKEKWTVEEPIGVSETSALRIKQAVRPDGAYSLTEFEVLERKKGFTLMKVKPKTGRTHQIRVHAQWSGLPLVGDKKYCLDEAITLEYLNEGFTDRVKETVFFDRLCLHATNLEFDHPVCGKKCSITSPCPDDMMAIWESL